MKLKKLGIVLLVAVLGLTLCGCSREEAQEKAEEFKETVNETAKKIEEKADELPDKLEEKVDELEEKIDEVSDELTSNKTPEPTKEPTPEPTPEQVQTSGIRPEFKEAMDAYEAFYAEYCEFLKEYQKNPSDLGLLTKYATMMKKAEEADRAFEKWDDEDLNKEELAYYIDVTARIEKMLLDAMPE